MEPRVEEPLPGGGAAVPGKVPMEGEEVKTPAAAPDSESPMEGEAEAVAEE
jgi:hypothetical protein